MTGVNGVLAPPPDDDSSLRLSVATARDRLLRGRGPGADTEEIAHHTRDRAEIGGIPTSDLLERTAGAAAAARGSVAALAAVVAARRGQVRDSLDVLAERLRTAGRRRAPGRLAIALVVGAVVGYGLRSRQSARRKAGPRANRPAPGRSR